MACRLTTKSAAAPARPRASASTSIRSRMRVLGGAFHAIAEEMAGVLFRMSYSSIIRESEDLGAGIFDVEGRELCESESTPMHIGSLPWYIRGFMQRLKGEIKEGDVIVHNHPYLGRLAHARHRGRGADLRARASCSASRPSPRTCSTSAARTRASTPTRSTCTPRPSSTTRCGGTSEGELNEDVDRMIFDNVRTETMNRGDMKAMMAACNLGRDRFLRLIAALRRRDDDERRRTAGWTTPRRCCASRSRRSPTASTPRRRPGSTTTPATATCGCGSRRR